MINTLGESIRIYYIGSFVSFIVSIFYCQVMFSVDNILDSIVSLAERYNTDLETMKFRVTITHAVFSFICSWLCFIWMMRDIVLLKKTRG